MILTLMSSHLVETMMINVEDFSESFLTCGTCLSGYDSAAHSAKLLPCSHTVCRTCLERILETQKSTDDCEADEETMRCPICRETILVPRGSGGSATFPPAFIVNQLLDLMASQRRDRVPKCRRHPNQELLFCETCDVIFCPDCRGGSTRGHATEACSGVDASGGGGGSGAALSHNVISFSVAIKRCSEILLYKASLCVQELNSAQEAVNAELQRLAESTEACVAAAESSFAEIRALVERRQAEVTQSIRRISEEKRHALEDQLALIESERGLVREQCDRLNSLIDVRSISKGISYLNDKLDTIASLTEPRENAFLRYHDNPPSPPSLQQSVRGECSALTAATRTTTPQPGSASFVDIARCLAAFGRIAVSTTYPPLCTAKLPEELYLHLLAKVMVRAYDYHGEPQTAGTDPINVRFEDAQGREAPVCLVDHGDGTYEVSLCALSPGAHCLVVQILSRPIRGSPFNLHVRGRQRARWSIVDGPDGRGLVQPFAVAVVPSSRFQTPTATTIPTPPDDSVNVLLLDTGNSRLLVADAATGRVKSVLGGSEALRGQAATGMALGPRGLWIVNWRANELMLLDLQSNEIVDRISSSRFVEPTSVCICPCTGRILVADNGAGCIFAYHNGEVHPLIGGGSDSSSNSSSSSNSGSGAVSAQNSCRGVRKFASAERFMNDALRRITGICVMTSGEIVLATGSELRIYSSDGAYIGSLYAPLSSGGGRGGMSVQSQMPVPPTASASDEVDADVCLPSTLTYNSQLRSQRPASCSGSGLSSAPGSTLTLDATTTHQSLRRPPSIGGSMRPTTSVTGCVGRRGVASASCAATAALRGHFGGVCATRTTTDLGECLLATHTDRSRSAVVVYPEVVWRAVIADTSSCVTAAGESVARGEGESKLGLGAEELGVSLMRQARRQAYTLEVEPGMRRLAGLAVLSDTSPFLVAVDLGGQSAHCLRFV
ncbi:Tripartite motif-containing protein 3 [Echinococcus granulosus]|nr:Tripartite motif-containing protein 3 [Echinococcus granulosus]